MKPNPKKPPAAPPVYRPQPTPKVLQRKVATHKPQAIHKPQATQTVRRVSSPNSHKVAAAIQLSEGPPVGKTTQQLRQMHQLRRMARAMPSVTGNEQADRESQEEARQRLARTTTSVQILDQVKAEDWATKRIRKTSAEVNFDINAREGETNKATTPTIRPVIGLGNEALTSLEMGRITLRHELDHAKLQEDGKKLTVGSFVASYRGRSKDERTPKGSFEYELEELIVRLRDWQRFKQRKTLPTPEYSIDRAQDRIKRQFAKMCKAEDISDYNQSDVADVIDKLRLIARELNAALE